MWVNDSALKVPLQSSKISWLCDCIIKYVPLCNVHTLTKSISTSIIYIHRMAMASPVHEFQYSIAQQILPNIVLKIKMSFFLPRNRFPHIDLFHRFFFFFFIVVVDFGSKWIGSFTVHIFK